MKRQKTSALVCLIYCAVAFWFGAFHHHEDLASSQHSCAACAWQSASTSDGFVAAIFVPIPPPVERVPAPAVSVLPAVFLLTGQSRAPPVAFV
jgi:hypothetical protein